MRGEISSGQFDKRHPYDWYVEPEWTTGQLAQALGGFAAERDAGEAVYDPAAGSGRVLSAVQDRGVAMLASDIVWRLDTTLFLEAEPVFACEDFLDIAAAPRPCSIVSNPPYSYCKGHGDYAGMLISEAFARHALRLTSRRVCLLLPAKWLASQARYRLFTEFPPQAVLHLTQRPSMPPGDRIAAMGNRAFRGGMIDYVWIVWDVRRPTKPGETRAIWLPPLGQPIAPIEGIA